MALPNLRLRGGSYYWRKKLTVLGMPIPLSLPLGTGSFKRAWTPQKAADYAHDIELLAKKGYLAWVDVTLLSGGTEIKAVRFDVDTDAGSLRRIARPT